ncbi:putative AAA family ATPase [Rosellinia necatrix]|uniref:Putative AAA family ATPase n=1 Tax=Rosellinia necatrix TaxID=77044 RepID=A0A1S8A8Z1_ROSNE|nr:putative AAA family ATPase [Rosellinia necatrix]
MYQRIQIWINCISRLETLEETGIDIDDLRDHAEALAKHQMNGRQIRNAIKTARRYAKWEKQRLGYEMKEEIIETSGRFDEYLEKLNGGRSQATLTTLAQFRPSSPSRTPRIAAGHEKRPAGGAHRGWTSSRSTIMNSLDGLPHPGTLWRPMQAIHTQDGVELERP